MIKRLFSGCAMSVDVKTNGARVLNRMVESTHLPSVADYARLFQIKEDTLRHWLMEGRFPTFGYLVALKMLTNLYNEGKISIEDIDKVATELKEELER